MNRTTNSFFQGSETKTESGQDRLNSSTVTQSDLVSTPWQFITNSNTISGLKKVRAESEIPNLKVAAFK